MNNSEILKKAKELVELLEKQEKSCKVRLSELNSGDIFQTTGKRKYKVLEQYTEHTKIISLGFVKENVKFECSCGIRKKMIHRNQLKFAEIPDIYKDAMFNNFRSAVYQLPESRETIKQAAKAVRYWVENIGNMQKQGIGLYFYSSTKGSGKTRMVCSLANELIEKHQKQVKFSTSMRILDEIKSTWGKRYSPGKTEEQLIDELSRADILIIDDFGTEIEKDWVNEKYYEIIDGRYTSRKITIFTSNYCISRLNYDERITNRILERSLEIPFPEESVREHIAETMKQQMIAGIMGDGK